MFKVFVVICFALFVGALIWAYRKDYKANPRIFKATVISMAVAFAVFVAREIIGSYISEYWSIF